jgi:hypothetical protein
MMALNWWQAEGYRRSEVDLRLLGGKLKVASAKL